jgi:hypothetical protein
MTGAIDENRDAKVQATCVGAIGSVSFVFVVCLCSMAGRRISRPQGQRHRLRKVLDELAHKVARYFSEASTGALHISNFMHTSQPYRWSATVCSGT